MFKPELIKGTVTHLKTLEGKHNFVMSGAAQAATGAAAAGAAVVGSFFSSSLLARSALSLKEDAVFFTCEVNGLQLSGCFNTLNLKEGEEVELVVETNHSQREGVIYAIRKPQQRCLWVVPLMEAGHGVVQRTALLFPLFILKYFLPVIAVIFFFVFGFNLSDKSLWIEFIINVGGGGALVYVIGVISIYLATVPKSKQATQVIAALGFKDAANIGLGTVSFEAKKKWEAESGKPFPSEQYDEFALFY
ncbi:MAG: putative type VI secretion system effector [Cellvibrionaceae bacterium]